MVVQKLKYGDRILEEAANDPPQVGYQIDWEQSELDGQTMLNWRPHSKEGRQRSPAGRLASHLKDWQSWMVVCARLRTQHRLCRLLALQNRNPGKLVLRTVTANSWKAGRLTEI